MSLCFLLPRPPVPSHPRLLHLCFFCLVDYSLVSPLRCHLLSLLLTVPSPHLLWSTPILCMCASHFSFSVNLRYMANCPSPLGNLSVCFAASARSQLSCEGTPISPTPRTCPIAALSSCRGFLWACLLCYVLNSFKVRNPYS